MDNKITVKMIRMFW